MALFGMFGNKENKQKTEKKTFDALDLNSKNIRDLATLCAADPTSKSVYPISLQLKEFGYPKDSKPLYFDVARIKENIPTIFYLFGQLDIVHRNFHALPLKDVLMKYDKSFWSDDKGSPILLSHLALAAKVMNHPDAKTNSCIMSSEATPTLSPKDPNFPEWWEQNKSKWEER